MNNLFLKSFFIYFFLASSLTPLHGFTVSPCNKTPYPETCNHFIAITTTAATTAATSSLEQNHFAFRNVAIKVTLDQAVQAYKLVSSMDLTSFDKRAKAAWTDCLELYDDSISHLNRSMQSSNHDDTQTWLSAATANHQTCKNGFNDFGLSYHLNSLPTMLTNFSYMLSNSLYINKVATASLSGGGFRRRRLLSDGFPAWVSAADRKLLQSSVSADVVVASDGSGDFTSINAAVAASKSAGGRRFVIHVKSGVYKENVLIKRAIKNIMIVGDGMGSTIVTGNKNAQDGSTTYASATFAVMGDGFIARDITFENTAGAGKHQAVALRSGSDHSVFYSCGIKGFQDTLYVYHQRQFYKNCDIYGSIDFIFGDAAVVIQSSNIYARKSSTNQWTTVTAQGRTDQNENTGISIHDCQVSGDSGAKTYLGRPWQKYSRTVFMKSTLGSNIEPAGWLPWSGSFALSTLYYGEFGNTGSGSGTGGRVKWPGYHVMDAADAGKFTVGSFLAGSSWIPSTGVPFTAGL